MENFVKETNPAILEVSLCSLHLRCPESRRLYGKEWRFMTSLAIATQLAPLHCQGGHEHQPAEGSSGGQLRSVQTQVYPKTLIRKKLAGFHREEGCNLCFAVIEEQQKSDDTNLKESKRKIHQAIQKMHNNLGHASNSDLVRILRHAGAQDKVLDMVKQFSCPTCDARAEPKITRNSTVPKDVAPLRYVGLDVKWLPGFKTGERIKALNVVCRASGLQQMTPFRETESSEVIRKLYRQSWTRPYMVDQNG